MFFDHFVVGDLYREVIERLRCRGKIGHATCFRWAEWVSINKRRIDVGEKVRLRKNNVISYIHISIAG